jgi:propionate CoA-transferase
LRGRVAVVSHSKFDVAIIRAPPATRTANITIEHEPVNLEMRTIAMAVKACGGKVIVQVKNAVRAAASLPTGWRSGDLCGCSGVPPTPSRSTARPRLIFTTPACPVISTSRGLHPALPLDVRKVLAAGPPWN